MHGLVERGVGEGLVGEVMGLEVAPMCVMLCGPCNPLGRVMPLQAASPMSSPASIVRDAAHLANRRRSGWQNSYPLVNQGAWRVTGTVREVARLEPMHSTSPSRSVHRMRARPTNAFRIAETHVEAHCQMKGKMLKSISRFGPAARERKGEGPMHTQFAAGHQTIDPELPDDWDAMKVGNAKQLIIDALVMSNQILEYVQLYLFDKVMPGAERPRKLKVLLDFYFGLKPDSDELMYAHVMNQIVAGLELAKTGLLAPVLPIVDVRQTGGLAGVQLQCLGMLNSSLFDQSAVSFSRR